MPPEIERRLAAILSADVAGYSRLMAAAEQSTVRTITAYREQIGSLVIDHRGRVVDATGDNALAEFPTALDAVEAAVEIQGVLRARNERLPEDRRMEFRIGVHLGDVTVEGERIYGDGVNIAARLQGLAEPGGICISYAVHEQVRSKLGVAYEDLGEQAVKNIPEPVRVFRILDEAPAARPTATTTADRPSIVVLPFADMSQEKDQEYFCDGMAEEVINALAQLEGLHVVARTSAFSFKGRDVDIREIGDKLGVRSVLEGSVRKAGDRLRVTAQLINVADGYHLWSERFDRQLDDVFAIQDQISAAIVDALRVELMPGAARLNPGRTGSRKAHDLYLRGLYYQGLDTLSGFAKAAECFEDALSVDPDYAAALASSSRTYTELATHRGGHDEARQRAEPAAVRALEIDESLAAGHVALGNVRSWFYWDWEGTEQEFRRAIELSPNDPVPHAQLALRCLCPTGRTQESVTEMRRALEMDPVSVYSNRNLGLALYFDRQFDEAIRQLRHTLAMSPDNFQSYGTLLMAYSSNDMPEEALHLRLQALRGAGRKTEAREVEAAYDKDGEPGMLGWYLEQELPKAEKERRLGQSGNRAENMAMLLARLGEKEEALPWLEEAIQRHSIQHPLFKVNPWLDGLRSHPRYEALLKTMNLAD